MSELSDTKITVNLKVRALITEKAVSEYLAGRRKVAYTRYTYYGIKDLSPLPTSDGHRKRRPSYELVKDLVIFHNKQAKRDYISKNCDNKAHCAITP